MESCGLNNDQGGQIRTRSKRHDDPSEEMFENGGVQPFTRKRVKREPKPLWVPVIPSSVNFGTEPYSMVCSTMTWPQITTISCEAAMYKRFREHFYMIGGRVELHRREAINSKSGAWYTPILRYLKSPKEKSAHVKNQEIGSDERIHLNSCTVTVSVAVEDIRKYFQDYNNLPLAVLVGEDPGNCRLETHFATIIIFKYDQKWNFLIRTPVPFKDFVLRRGIVKKLVTQLGGTQFTLITEDSGNQIGNTTEFAFRTVCKVMEGSYSTDLASAPGNTIKYFKLSKLSWIPNDTQDNELMFTEQKMPIANSSSNSTLVQEVNLTEKEKIKLEKYYKMLVTHPLVFLDPPEQKPKIVVESIVGRRVKKGRLEYRVHWLGYDDKEDTWQDVSNLTNSMNLVVPFEKEYERSYLSKLKTIRPCHKILLKNIDPISYNKF